MIKEKAIFGQFSLGGEQVIENDLIHYVFKGLDSWYLYFVSDIKKQETRPSIDTLLSLVEDYKRSL